MRTNKELLKLLLANINRLTQGLCFIADRLRDDDLITFDEKVSIKNYINTNRPKKTSKLYDANMKNSWHYWHTGEKEMRVRWLKYHIRICKS